MHLRTTRNAAGHDSTDRPGEVQNLSYFYDPAGNITHIQDDAQDTIYFKNQKVEPSNDYFRDAIYRLIQASGREHLGQNGTPIPDSYNDAQRAGLLSPNAPLFAPDDRKAMGRYREIYQYDEVGNFITMSHSRTDGSGGWTRSYTYNEDSQLEIGQESNRLTSTNIGNGSYEVYSRMRDGYDPHGNMLRMPQLYVMQWDFKDRLLMTQRQRVNSDDGDGSTHNGERTYYVYDIGGQRVRKVTNRQAAAGVMPTRMKERIYVEGYEVYREYRNDGDTLSLERQTVHVMDDKKRIALVETKIVDTSVPHFVPTSLVRYQFGSHLGSVSLELDNDAQIISYEEYAPYGSTSYQAVRSETEAAKRYRYARMERDEESGLSYQSARYYAMQIARWISPDPAGFQDGTNRYEFVRSNPIEYSDPNGQTAKLHDLWDYDKPIPNRDSLGATNPQKDHVIAQEKLRILKDDPKGIKNYKPGKDPTVLEDTGKATGQSPAKPHTQKTFHDPQSDVREIKRLKNSGIKSVTGDIVEPSRNAALRSGYPQPQTDTAIQGQLDNAFAKDPSPKGWQSQNAKPLPEQAVAKESASLQAIKPFDPSAPISAAVTSAAEKANSVQAKAVGSGNLKGFDEFGPKPNVRPGEGGSIEIGTALALPSVALGVLGTYTAIGNAQIDAQDTGSNLPVERAVAKEAAGWGGSIIGGVAAEAVGASLIVGFGFAAAGGAAAASLVVGSEDPRFVEAYHESRIFGGL